MPWRHSRRYSNQLQSSSSPSNLSVGQGNNWLSVDWPYLVESETQIVVVRSVSQSLWFEKVSGNLVGRFGAKSTLLHDEENGLYVLTATDGIRQEFHDFSGGGSSSSSSSSDLSSPSGLFYREIAPGEQTTTVTSYVDGRNGEVQRSGSVGGTTTTEAYVFAYDDNTDITSVTLRRQVGMGGWLDVRRAVYSYFGDSEDFGSLGDLKHVRIQEPTSTSWSDIRQTAYRYYKDGEPDGFIHGLKFVIEPSTYQKMINNSVDPLTASDSIVATYADYYFEYNVDRRATLERVDGGSRAFGFDYTVGPGSGSSNEWSAKTVETLPDGNENIVYTNKLGQLLIKELKSGSDRWIDAYNYDSDFRLVWHANPSAVIGYDDSQADLDIEIRPSSGLIEVNEYYAISGSRAAPGYLSARKIKQGSSGTEILLESLEYSSHTAGGSTVYPISKRTVYRNDNGTGAQETSYEYTYYSGTTQVREMVTTYPVVPTTQNGSGVAATSRVYYDERGRTSWTMNERGYIDHVIYDLATGALIQQITDVDTSTATGVPSGWSTQSDGGLNLVTDFQSDDLGRTIQTLGPVHTIDLSGTATSVRTATWTVYNDEQHEVYSAQGYATGTSPGYSYTLINPVSISKSDAGGKTLASIQAVSSSTSGTLEQIISTAGGGAVAFPQSSYSRLTTMQYIDCCLVASQRVYFDIPTSGAGTLNVNYNETTFGYDIMKRRSRTVSPGGTITDLVYDARGLVVATYLGTNDDGATESDPTGGGSDPDNDMVIVSANVYDDGQDGGDGNLTSVTLYASASDTRVTNYDYDWRNRQTTIDGEIDLYQVSTYDNLNHVVKVQRYNTFSSGNLISQQVTHFDDRGRIYQSLTYEVDPATGTIGYALTNNSWYDATGNIIKSFPAGSRIFTKTTYDSLGRTSIVYTGYDLGETTYAQVQTVDGDTILQQIEYIYDDVANLIETIRRQRYHNAAPSEAGRLGDPSTTPEARVDYMAFYADAIGRNIASANYGTHAGVPLTRSATIPARSDTTLINSLVYDEAGNQSSMIGPDGLVTTMDYDDMGRNITRIVNPGTLSSDGACPASDDTNLITRTIYNADGNVASLTAENSQTGNQTTQYLYGTTLVDSEIASSLLKRQEIYPDSVGGSDVMLFSYNRQSQILTKTDQNGSVHTYDYDKLGRMTQDRMTTLGSGVQGAVQRIAMTYDVRGLNQTVTSYDNPAVGTGNILNEVRQAYNGFGQLITEYQSHAGAVNLSTTPRVAIGYASGVANTIRPESLAYPDGRIVTFDYGPSASMNDVASRVASLIDSDPSSTHLVDYLYLGLNTIIQQTSPEAELRYSWISQSSGTDPETGDIYGGLDRFGRIRNLIWENYVSTTNLSQLEYGYDRASQRLWTKDPTAASYSQEADELYTYDAAERLKTFGRGVLASGNASLNTTNFAQCWTLDATANWRGFNQSNDGTNWSLEQTRSCNMVNEITAINATTGSNWATPAYDANGNMTSIPNPASSHPNWSTLTPEQWSMLSVDDWTGLEVASVLRET